MAEADGDGYLVAERKRAQLSRSHAAGEWWLLPPYPFGHVQIDAHQPYSDRTFGELALFTALLLVSRVAVRRLAPSVGRWVAARLHGREWLDDGMPGSKLDWTRFGDHVYYLFVHLGLTLTFVTTLRLEARRWLAERSSWWEFVQPRLSDELQRYTLLQLAVTIEACLVMLATLVVSRGGADKVRDPCYPLLPLLPLLTPAPLPPPCLPLAPSSTP